MSTVALTYRELAERLGVKPESARKTAQRKRWHRTTGNDGTTRIHVPLEALPVTGDSPSDTSRDSHGDSPTPSPNPIHELQTRVAVLETELAAERRLTDAERQLRQAAETDRDAWQEQAKAWQAQAERLAAPKPGLLGRLFSRKSVA
jgi:hypothetical protein